MFTTKENIKERTGHDVDAETLATAHMMVEAYVGRSENDVVDAGDRAALERATVFQAVYINGKAQDMLEQIGVTNMTVGATDMSFDASMLAPYMSPWAVLSCRKLTWMGSYSVHTGPIFDRAPVRTVWERD